MYMAIFSSCRNLYIIFKSQSGCTDNKAPLALFIFSVLCLSVVALVISHAGWNSPQWSSCRAKALKVRSFPPHQASAELMNPRGPAPALWSEHYSRAKQGKRRLPVLLRLSKPLRTHTQIMTVELAGSQRSLQHLLIPCDISGELNQATLRYG